VALGSRQARPPGRPGERRGPRSKTGTPFAAPTARAPSR